MLDTPDVKNIYKEIQKKLYYMVPEKWDKLYLYATIKEKIANEPNGEMYFYYFPKGILKKNPINVYEIPAKFNIDEQSYMKLVQNLYGSIENLWKEYKENTDKVWTNINIFIENYKFKIEYNYKTIDTSEYTSYERHIIWRYEHLGIERNTVNKNERSVIERYLNDKNIKKEKPEIYEEPVYKNPIHNIMKTTKSNYGTSLKLDVMEEFEIERKQANNQILASIKENK